MEEERAWRQLYPLYDAFCREDEVEYDPYAEAEARWEAQDGR